MSSVDWANPQPHTRTIKGKPFTEKRFWVTCSCCDSKRLLKRCDARKVEASGAPCQRCTNVQKGKLGFKASVAKFGADFANKKAREKRLAHPSRLEALVIDALEDLHLRYMREVECGPYYIDFVVRGVAIEVEGAYVHSLRDPNREAKRTAFIEQQYPMLILREADAPQFLSIIARQFLEKRYVKQQTLFAHA